MQLMSAKPKSAYSSANVDHEALRELQLVSEIGVFGDLAPLISFIQKGTLTKIVHCITHFSSVNEIGQLARTTKPLVQILEVINFVLHEPEEKSTHLAIKLSLLEEKDRIAEFYSEFCTNLKVVYKTYGLRKPASVIALTKVLQCLLEYGNHSIIIKFLDLFDFNHPTILKILVPTKDDFEKKVLPLESMRSSFVTLWIAICASSNAALRKAILTNFKNMNNFWKYMEMERYEIITKVMKFLDRYVLGEQSFKRATKCQILNENFLYNFRSMFALIKNENDRKDDDDLEDFSVFKTSFVAFMNTLVTDQTKGITYPQNEFGSPLVINNVTFKINNKLIYTLLTSLKPWESFTQLQYVMKILTHNDELVPPYMNWIVASSGGYHDPSLSSYWIGHTLLYTEILKAHDLPLKSEYISLVPLSKSAMTECIAYPTDLVKQLSLQLILLELKRLTDSTTSSPNQALVESVLANLPPNAAYLPLLAHKNDLIRLAATEIVVKLEHLVPSSSSSSIVSLVSKSLMEMDIATCGRLDLIFLDKYLSIQSNNDLKWWQKSSLGNSFFTSLLKLSNIPILNKRILQILNRITSSTLAFNKINSIESPLLLLIESTAPIMDSELCSKLWNCLDETISRSVLTPYKYLDQSHKDFDDLSVFVVALFEQLNFIANIQSEKAILKWLDSLMTKLAIVGEPLSAIRKISEMNNFDLNIDFDNLKSKEQIITRLDFAETVLFLNQAVKVPKKDSSIFDFFNRMGDYLLTQPLSDKSLLKFITNPTRWAFLTSLSSGHELTDNEILATSLFADLLEHLNFDFTMTSLNEFIFELCTTTLSKLKQALLSKYLWVLRENQLLTLSGQFSNEKIILGVYRTLIIRGIEFSPNYPKLLNIKSPEVVEILKCCPLDVEFFPMIMQDSRLHFLLKDPSQDLIDFLLNSETVEDAVLYHVAHSSSELVNKHKDRIISLARSLSDWDQSLRIFTSHPDIFDANEVLSLNFAKARNSFKLSMTTEFVDFLKKHILFLDLPATQAEMNYWLHKAMLYVTKKFAESATLSVKFDSFLISFSSLIESLDGFWSRIPLSIINSQLEVLLAHQSWIQFEKYVTYVNTIILLAQPNLIDSKKLIGLFATNQKNQLFKNPDKEHAELRSQSALILYTLFRFNETELSTLTFLKQILVFYFGSTRADDLLIKTILSLIEKKILKSWISLVSNWDFLEVSESDLDLVGEEKLMIRDRSSFVVALNKAFVKNTILNYVGTPAISVVNLLDDFHSFAEKCPVGAYHETSYDPEFLMLAIINNKELVNEEDGLVKFNMPKLIDSGLLRVIVTSLSFNGVRDLARIILNGMLRFLVKHESEMKDKNVLKVYLASVLHTMRESDHTSSVVWYTVGSFVEILTNPGHFLYERVFRCVLSTPTYKATEIPLFQTISLCLSNNDAIEEENYYRQATWMVQQLAGGVKTKHDLKVLRNNGVIEWVLNVSNSPYLNGAQKSKFLRFLYDVQRMDKEGSDMLVTKYASLSSLEVMKPSNGNSVFSNTTQSLNVDQIALRFGIASNSQKRVRDWTCDNVESAIKRIHSI